MVLFNDSLGLIFSFTFILSLFFLVSGVAHLFSWSIKKSEKSWGLCYKPFPHISRDFIHLFHDPSTNSDATQALWTI